MPSTIVFDRADFVANRDNFQQAINDNVENWRVIQNINRIPTTEFIVIHWREEWYRAIVKLIDNRKRVFQLVDLSSVVRDSFTIPKRQIDSPEILAKSLGRVKGYLYVAMYVFNATVTPKIQEIYDSFFNRANNVTAVLVKIPQITPNLLRHVYACDFVTNTGQKFESFRELLLNSNVNSLKNSAHMNRIENV